MEPPVPCADVGKCVEAPEVGAEPPPPPEVTVLVFWEVLVFVFIVVVGVDVDCVVVAVDDDCVSVGCVVVVVTFVIKSSAVQPSAPESKSILHHV